MIWKWKQYIEGNLKISAPFWLNLRLTFLKVCIGPFSCVSPLKSCLSARLYVIHSPIYQTNLIFIQTLRHYCKANQRSSSSVKHSHFYPISFFLSGISMRWLPTIHGERLRDFVRLVVSLQQVLREPQTKDNGFFLIYHPRPLCLPSPHNFWKFCPDSLICFQHFKWPWNSPAIWN